MVTANVPTAKTLAQAPTFAHIVSRTISGWWIIVSSALLLVLLFGTGCAAEAEDGGVHVDVSLGSGTSIFGGAPDNDERSISSVVALKVGSAGSYELCSGALVAPNVVLTARHCVANSLTTSVSCDEDGRSTNGAHVAGNLRPENVAVYVGATPKFSRAADAVGKAIVAPDNDHLCDSDIALVVLDRAIPDIEPLAVRLRGRVRPTERIRSVGYGQNDKHLPIGTRLRKEGVEVLAMGRGISSSKTALGRHEFEVGRSICQGDSGGPAINEKTGAVVGVVSRGGDCSDDYGHIYTTTSGWDSLFDQAFAIAGGAPIDEPGDDLSHDDESPASSTPEEAPLAYSYSPRPQGSCSATGGPAGNGSRASLALLLACALVLSARASRRV
jgi:hypothetical protein